MDSYNHNSTDISLPLPVDLNTKSSPKKIAVPSMDKPGTHVSFEEYTQEEILNTPGLTGDAKLVLLKIHFLDSLTQKGCFASNDHIADESGMCYGTVRNVCARLKKKKLLYTLGFTRHGMAFRRVKLLHTLDPKISGVRLPDKATGGWRWRRHRESNPRVIPRQISQNDLAHEAAPSLDRTMMAR